jgi:hypothetical protein
MTKTNFNYIEASVDANIKALPPNISEDCLHYVGGFPVPDPSKLEEKKEQHNRLHDTYVSDRKALKEQLAAQGVKVKAFIPLRVWDKLCVENRLFRMQPDANNNINVNVESDDIIRSWQNWSILAMCLAAVAVHIAITYSIYQTPVGNHLHNSEDALGYFLVGGVGLVIGMAILCGIIFGVFEETTTRLHLWLHIKIMTKHRMLLHFLPNYEEGFIHKIRLVLPSAPDSVKDTLSKLIKNPRSLRVAAVADAIQFDQTFFHILNKDAVKQREIRALEMRNDPIIYDQLGSCVAIIEQFGDFPIEKETVDRLINMEYLL